MADHPFPPRLAITPPMRERAAGLLDGAVKGAPTPRAADRERLRKMAGGETQFTTADWWRTINGAAMPKLADAERLRKLAGHLQPGANNSEAERNTARTMFERALARVGSPPGLERRDWREVLWREDLAEERRKAEAAAEAARAAKEAARQDTHHAPPPGDTHRSDTHYTAARDAHRSEDTHHREARDTHQGDTHHAEPEAKPKRKDTRKGDRHKPRKGDRHSPGYKARWAAAKRERDKPKRDPELETEIEEEAA
jgi:hypothetical protein